MSSETQTETQARCTVLVVDDDELQRQMLAKRLRNLGCEVEEAEDGAAAFLKWQTRAFDVIVTDWHMPKVDGQELARLVRSQERFSPRRDVIFVCISAELVEEATFFAGLEGRNMFIKKPLMGAAIKEIIALGNQSAASQAASAR